MSTIYILDGHTNPIANSDINEVRYNITTAPLTGHFIVRIPDDMPLSVEPSNLGVLLSEKYQSVLAYFATFSSVVYEDFTSSPGVDNANSPGTYEGVRCTTRIGPRVGGSGGQLQTDVVVLGSAPALIATTWEIFQVDQTNPKDGRLTRSFAELASSGITGEISFNGGGTWTAISDRGITSIALADQGLNMVLRFRNASSTLSRWMGSWAVLF